MARPDALDRLGQPTSAVGSKGRSSADFARPLYENIKEYVRDHIASEAWPPGHRVPSENELVSQFSVSRMTAHRALRELQQEGMLVRRAGVGTFVGKPPSQTSLIDIRNIAEEIASRGNRHSARVHNKATVRATPELAQDFEIGAQEELFHLVLVHRERTGRGKGVPVQLEDRLVNKAVVPEFLKQDFRKITPTEFLLATVQPDELEHTVTAITASKEQQALLEITAKEPCLALRRRSWSAGRVVTVANLIYPASRYALYGRHHL